MRSPGLRVTGVPYRMEEARPLAKMFAKEVLPGSPVYGMYMVRDRIRLIFTPDIYKRTALFQEYSVYRMGRAMAVFLNGECSLAISTASKAQVYLGRAVENVTKLKQSGGADTALLREQAVSLYGTLLEHESLLHELRERCGNQQDTMRLDSLIEYNRSLQQSIHGEL